METGPIALNRRQTLLSLAVSPEIVPHHMQLTAQFLSQVVKEPDEIFGAGVVCQKLEEHPHAAAPRRKRQRRDDADSVATVPLVEHWRPPPLGPRATHQRLKLEARFVDKHQASLISLAPFLSSATVSRATPKPRRAFAPCFAVAVSGRKIPAYVAAGPDGWDDTKSQTSAARVPRPEPGSINRWQSPTDGAQHAGNALSRPAARATAGNLAHVAAWKPEPELFRHASQPAFSRRSPIAGWPRLRVRHPLPSSPPRAVSPLVADGLPNRTMFHEVSYAQVQSITQLVSSSLRIDQ